MLLLDTHVLLWWLDDNPELLTDTRDKISVTPSVFVSLASCWEIALKVSIGKLEFPLDLMETEITNNHFTPLPINISHIRQTAQLPMFHRDPFDRMLIAQALTESLILVTRDELLAGYGVRTLAA
jgi:PIN domain nuclease of toxin-antitoxin system